MAQTVTAKQTVQNMTEGSPVSLILRFALPIFISQVFQQLYSTADAFIVGKYLGTNAFAAVSSSGTLIMLLTSLFIGTAMGAGVAISKYFGADDYENVSRAIHTNLAFGIVSGAILTVIGVFLTPTFLIWMNTDAQVMPETNCQGLFNQIHKNLQKRCQKHRMAPDTSFDRLHFSVQQVFAEIRIVWQLVDIWLPAPLDFRQFQRIGFLQCMIVACHI